MTVVESILDVRTELGEGPVWHGGYLYWLNITGGHLYRFDPATGRNESTQYLQMIGAVAPRRGGGFVAAMEKGFALIEFGNETIRMLAEPESHLPGNRFNDGKCDPQGRFWAGTMEREPATPAGTMYMLDADRKVHKRFGGIRISNGLCWSLDGRTFYHNDTLTHQIAAYDFDPETGNLGERRVAVQIPERDGYPDGMTIDTDGNLWVAMWAGSAVICFDPKAGKEIRRIAMPVSQPSSVTFGGRDLGDLYITSARQDIPAEQLAKEPRAGNLFRCRPGVQGVPVNEYAG